jgi:small subunit ribosomal protein S2
MVEEAQVGELIGMKQLLEAGVHFGHQVSHWNPRMKPFIFGSRNGIHIIDLQQTVNLFRKAFNFVKDIVADGGEVLIVGTKKQAQGIIAEEAIRCGMPFVNTRWLGGTLTNFHTIRSRIDYLLELKSLESEGQMERLPKKEAKGLKREIQKLEYLLNGIVNMKKVPEALFIIDTKKEHIAVSEAKKLNIPIVAVVDTNCDPTNADIIIPSNDDAIRAIKLFTSKVADACLEGKHIYDQRVAAGEIIKPEEDKAPVIVERKVFIFKEYGQADEAETGLSSEVYSADLTENTEEKENE